MIETSEDRQTRFARAIRAEDFALANRIANEPLPTEWPEDVRRLWGARRMLSELARIQPLALDPSEF